jgi:hypothetical protein
VYNLNDIPPLINSLKNQVADQNQIINSHLVISSEFQKQIEQNEIEKSKFE